MHSRPCQPAKQTTTCGLRRTPLNAYERQELPSSCRIHASQDRRRCRNFRVTVAGMAPRKRKKSGAVPTAKPQTSDQAPGEEVVQVNDQYKRRAAPPDMTQEEQAQHQTGG